MFFSQNSKQSFLSWTEKEFSFYNFLLQTSFKDISNEPSFPTCTKMYITFNILIFLSTKSERLCIIPISLPWHYQNNILFTKKKAILADLHSGFLLIMETCACCVCRNVNEEGLKVHIVQPQKVYYKPWKVKLYVLGKAKAGRWWEKVYFYIVSYSTPTDGVLWTVKGNANAGRWREKAYFYH